MKVIKYISVFYGLFFSSTLFSQVQIKEVEANIVLNKANDVITIVGKASNVTDLYKSLGYKLHVIKTNPITQNTSKNTQVGLFTLEPNQSRELSTTSINSEEKDEIVVLLVITDEEDNILTKDRLVINENKSKKRKIAKNEKVRQQEPDDGLEIKGIVSDDTRTKSGRDFYELFFNKYNFSGIKGSQPIKIEERISFGRKTMIEVYVSDKKVNQFVVQPKEEYLEAMTEITMRKVSRYFQRQKRQTAYIKQY